MRELTADTRIRIKRPRPELTGDTRIRLSQIKDLADWVEDQKYEIGQISSRTGLMKTTEGWVVPPHAAFHNNQENTGRKIGGGTSNKPNSRKKQKSIAQRKFEQNHKQTAAGNRSPENNTPRRRSPIKVHQDIPVTRTGHPGDKQIGTLLKGQKLTNVVSMARGKGIDCLQRLQNTYKKSDPEKWSKNEATGQVQIKNRTLNMKLHYYCYDDKEIYEPKPRF